MTPRATSDQESSTACGLLVAFCGGGSGGHIAPAVALSAALRQRTSVDLQFFISNRAVDQRMLAAAGDDLQAAVIVQPLQRSTPRISYLAAVIQSFLLCRRHWRRSPPQVVVGTGGFASLPGVLAARWLRIPVVLLELNRVPGQATRRLSRFATLLLTGGPLPPTFSPACRVCPVGVPLAPEWWQQLRSAVSRRPVSRRGGNRAQLLVLGGSQGARRLNQLLRTALTQLPADYEVHVVHQTGGEPDSDADQPDAVASVTEDGALPPHVRYSPIPFLEDIPQRLADADIVICRCGAMTLAEVAAAARPAILVPLSSSADDHQRHNAVCLATAGSADIIDERAADAAQALQAAVIRLLSSDELRDQMASAHRQRVDPQSAAHAVEQILAVAGAPSGDDDEPHNAPTTASRSDGGRPADQHADADDPRTG